MKQLIVVFIFLLLIISCAKKQPETQEDFYNVLNELLRFNYHDVDIVILELNKVHKSNNYSEIRINNNGDTINIMHFSDSPPGMITYSRDLFVNLYKDKLLDSVDVDYMFNQIDSLGDFTLDSTRIERQTLRNSAVATLFQKCTIDSAYKFLQNSYNCHSFIKISIPLISRDGNKMLFDIETYCGSLCGEGMTYLLEKKNRKWRIIFSKQGWIS
jgi:hypothetical protein